MDQVLTDYFAAWNESDGDERRRLLESSVTEDVELVQPAGRSHGIAEVSGRIAAYQAALPGAVVVPGSGVDAHNDVERYAWRIVDGDGRELLEGLDVTERAAGGRLRRILLFHGPLPAIDAAGEPGAA